MNLYNFRKFLLTLDIESIRDDSDFYFTRLNTEESISISIFNNKVNLVYFNNGGYRSYRNLTFKETIDILYGYIQDL
jgi:hypothetical protein